MPDGKLLENLIKTLQYEWRTYSGLLKTEEKKTDCLIKNDIKTLNEITEEEKKAVEQVRMLSSAREQLLAKFCDDNGQDYKTFTLTKLIEQVDDPYKKQLKDIGQKLNAAVNKLSARNKINQKLTENAIKYIDFSLQLISSPGPETPSYGRTGHEVLNTHKRSMLDVKF
jgi:Mg2+ and Co2+ transporter CorA